jgi:hypothetical protein
MRHSLQLSNFWTQGGAELEKNRMGRLIWPVAWTGALAAFGICGYATRAKGNQPFGRYTSLQAIDRSQALLRVTAGIHGTVTVSVDKMDEIREGRAVGKLWVAECDDSSGNYVAHVEWDAKSGEIVASSRSNRYGNVPSGAPINSRDALVYAGALLRSVDAPATPRRWRLTETPERTSCAWRIHCRSRDRLAVVCIDASSGQLLTMTVLHDMKVSQPARIASQTIPRPAALQRHPE